MTIMTFRPAIAGGWLAIAAGTRMLVVEPSTYELVPELWSSLGRDDGFEDAIGILTRNGFAATPAFVLVEWNGSAVRSIVRGAVALIVSEPDGEQVQSGEGVSTWTERSFPEAVGVHVAIEGAEQTPGIGQLPLVDGAVIVAGCAITLSGASAAIAADPARSTATDVSVVTVAGIPNDAASTRGGGADPTEAPGADYDYLFGNTVVRSVSGAAVRQADEATETVDIERAGDHDGHTVLTVDVAKLRAGRTSSPTPQEKSVPAEPRLLLALSTGSRELLDQPILVGRSPSVSKVSGDQMPRLVTVGGADQDISRNHARFALEGGTVVVTDLHSRNGTLVVLPGKDPQKLRAGEPTAVIVGAVVDLGGGITLTIAESDEVGSS